MKIMTWFSLLGSQRLARAACSLLAVCLVAEAKTLQVGPDKAFSTPCAAFAQAASGDTIEIDAGTYTGDVCTIYPSNLTIRGVSGQPKIDAAGQNAAGKGTWVIAGNNTVVENIEFTGARVPDKNGSGIRLDGNGLVVRNCYFHDNENGILTNNNTANEILIEYSEFGYNGAGDGQSHNMYIGTVAKFTLRYSYSHHANAGHLVKSRAAENYILYNRLTNEMDGMASYELDLPVGGKSYVIGNLIEQGPMTQNGTMLTYREEVNASYINASDELFIVNNTFVNDRPNGGTFIRIDPSVRTPAVIKNNIFVGSGTINTQTGAVFESNLVGQDPLFKDKENYDYHLTYKSPAIDAGVDPGLADGFSLTPSGQYIHTACGEGRQVYGRIDIGAYEFLGAAFNPEAPPRCITITPGGVVNSASFQAGPLAPGSIFSIFGSNLSREQEKAEKLPLPASLAGTSVTVNGLPAPLFYVSPGQINAQIPFETVPGPASVTVTVGDVSTAPESFIIAPAAPAIFVYGENHAVAQNQDWSLNSPQVPASPGSIVMVYMTGQGAVDPPVETGAAAPEKPLFRATEPYSATIGGEPATVRYLGLTPNLVGVSQANIQIPPLQGRTSGEYPLEVTIGGRRSNLAMLSISLPQ